MSFGDDDVVRKSEHKHLGMILDSKLDFQSHVKEAIQKARRGIGMIRYLSKYVSRDVLDQIYKLYVRPHLDYGDIIYHKYDPQMHLNFTQRLERTQYCAALTVTGAWRGTSREHSFIHSFILFIHDIHSVNFKITYFQMKVIDISNKPNKPILKASTVLPWIRA